MTASEIVSKLKQMGSDSYKRILVNHGANEPVLGIKIAELKKLQKQLRPDRPLALELYDTGIYDAQYLAGLITNDEEMTKKDLRHWLAKANCPAISGSVVAWTAAESRYGDELATNWIDSKKETVAHAGWLTLSSIIAITDDSCLDLPSLKRRLSVVKQSIHEQPNLVRYAMNDFIISVGIHVSGLTTTVIQIAQSVGTVAVDMGQTACEVPSAVTAIKTAQSRGKIGAKRKSARC